MERVHLTGKGTVVTYTVIHDAPAQFEMQKPYVMAIIQMEEGVRLTSQLIDVKPEHVKIGMKVQATFRKLGQEGEAGVIHYGYKFRPTARSVDSSHSAIEAIPRIRDGPSGSLAAPCDAEFHSEGTRGE